MNKFLILALLSVFPPNTGQSDNNKTMTDDEFSERIHEVR